MTAAISADDLASMWEASGDALHDPSYRRRHAAILAAAIGDTGRSIIDTACGVGFPALDLVRMGFRRIVGADADEGLLQRFDARLREAGAAVPLVRTSWQTIDRDVDSDFDVVLNVDASIGFMDSWGGRPMAEGEEAIFARVRSVLGNFHRLTKPGGMLVIGLQKNNNKGNRAHTEHVGARGPAGGPTARWEMSHDWVTRIKTWVNVLEVGGQEFRQTKTSYLFDKFELARFLYDAGYDRVHELATPPDLYEDLLCARRDRCDG